MHESIEFVIEGGSKEDVLDWLRGNTIKEVRVINSNIKKEYNEEIVEKTVFPAEVSIEDYVDDVEER
jgi:hypothetical protein